MAPTLTSPALRPAPRPALRLAAGAAVLVACGLGAAGCGTGGAGAGEGTGVTVTATSAPGGPTTPEGTATLEPGETPATPGRPTGTAAVHTEVPRGEPSLVTGVRFGRHATFDRIVIDFDGPVPGHTVQWTDELVQEGSGKPIDLGGRACLSVLLTPAVAHTEAGEPTWTGGAAPTSLGNVTDVIRAGDFEGRVLIGLAARSPRPFRVAGYTRPDRLVIDVAH
ncbi:AMIN-like domain-containing (lipo)protein [Nonomuraea muscovyensis]